MIFLKITPIFIPDLKKLIAIFCFTVYLFSSTEAYQLLKLPLLVQHFADHKKENKYITLLQFLDIHYMHGSPKDKDYDEDMKLPFKTCSHNFASVVAMVVPSQEFSLPPQPVSFVQQTKFVVRDQFFSSSFSARIWQPPRAC